MKRTKKAWLFFALQIIFIFITPCVFVWIQYGELTEGYKLSATTIILLLLIFWVFKRIFLNKWLKTFDTKIINIETNALSLTDKTAINTNKRAWRNYSLVSLFFNSIIPILLLALAIITIKTVEQGLIKLFGCLMFCLISIVIGVMFRVAEIYSISFPHETKE